MDIDELRTEVLAEDRHLSDNTCRISVPTGRVMSHNRQTLKGIDERNANVAGSSSSRKRTETGVRKKPTSKPSYRNSLTLSPEWLLNV